MMQIKTMYPFTRLEIVVNWWNFQLEGFVLKTVRLLQKSDDCFPGLNSIQNIAFIRYVSQESIPN